MRGRILATALAVCALAPAPAGAFSLVPGGAAPPEPEAPAFAFPVRGPHDYGTFENAFGGGRGHGGQDLLCDCGTPIVAARAGRVTFVDFHARAGHYAIVREPGGISEAYMHLAQRARVRVGERVEAGEVLGRAGQTGSATTCMLHFELWTAPGWYSGGHAVDPTPRLRSWDRRD
jgi:murein DD-endopeptidase MepM/ murein hydrolase activator NlpD